MKIRSRKVRSRRLDNGAPSMSPWTARGISLGFADAMFGEPGFEAPVGLLEEQCAGFTRQGMTIAYVNL